MIAPYYKSLIDSLIAKIKDGKSFWNGTSAKEQFKLILNKGMIVISHRFDIVNESIKFDVYDETGKIVDSISANARYESADYAELYRLYDAVKSQKDEVVQRRISDMLAEINSSDSIGKTE